MERPFFRSLIFFVLFFSATLTYGQSRVVLDQSINAIAFSPNGKSWGLEVDGVEIVEAGYKTVAFESGLFKLEDWQGNWMVIDQEGNDKLPKWSKASDIKISENHVILEKANGNKALIYDRKTWNLITAKEITYDDMYEETKKRLAEENGTPVLNYETAAEKSRRIYRTKPRYVAPKLSIDKASIVRGSNVIVSWTGKGEWLYPHRNLYGGSGGDFPYLGEDPYTTPLKELYFLLRNTEDNRNYVIWIMGDETDRYRITINGKKAGYVKITPHPMLPTRLMLCQTTDGVEHPIWAWGEPLINNLVPHESFNKGEETKKREALAKPHLNCSHCMQQSKIYNEK